MFSELAKKSSSDISLDEMFELQTLDLTKCILELSDLRDLKLIRRWHNILCKSTPTEHAARNELCAIMLDQLRREGKLSNVFRVKSNEFQSLNSLIQHIKEDTLSERLRLQDQVIEEDREGERREEEEDEEEKEETYAAVVTESKSDLGLSAKVPPSRTTICNIYYPHTTSSHSSEMKQLEHQLQSLQIKLDAQNQTLKLLSEKLKSHEKNTASQKRALEVLMLNIIQHFQNYFTSRTSGSKLPLRLFQAVFAPLTTDTQVHSKMRDLDRSLERAFNMYAKNVRNTAKLKFENKTLESTKKFRHSVLEEFETIASTQLWVQEVRLRAMKQQFLAALRTQLSKLKCERTKVNFNVDRIMKLVDHEYKKIFEDLPEGKT